MLGSSTLILRERLAQTSNCNSKVLGSLIFYSDGQMSGLPDHRVWSPHTGTCITSHHAWRSQLKHVHKLASLVGTTCKGFTILLYLGAGVQRAGCPARPQGCSGPIYLIQPSVHTVRPTSLSSGPGFSRQQSPGGPMLTCRGARANSIPG